LEGYIKGSSEVQIGDRLVSEGFDGRGREEGSDVRLGVECHELRVDHAATRDLGKEASSRLSEGSRSRSR
jgi:hypothetical protein